MKKSIEFIVSKDATEHTKKIGMRYCQKMTHFVFPIPVQSKFVPSGIDMQFLFITVIEYQDE